jgi:hypothetical protein
MTRAMKSLIVAALVLASGGAGAGTSGIADPLSGLPLAPGFKRTGDPIESYTFCGKSAKTALYAGAGFADLNHENAWYALAMPNAAVFAASTGVKIFITRDGTAAVETADTFVSYFRFVPGLSPAEIRILGVAPASRTCTAD